MEKSKRELIITISGIAIIVIALFTICYLSVVVKSGKMTRNVKLGTITMTYVDQNIAAVAPLKPMDDDVAMASTNYFAFKLTSKKPTTEYIYFDPLKDNTLDKKHVKVALTVYDGQKETTIGYPKMVMDFDNYSPGYGYLVYSGEINSEVEYRFRIWVDIGSKQEEVSNLKYRVRVNAYGAA